MGDFNVSDSTGSCVKFKPPIEIDTMMIGGVSTSIEARLQCITVMKEYQLKSLEELRLEDYLLKRKSGANVMNSTDAQKGTFASNSTTAFAPSTKRTFSMALQNPATTGFKFPSPTSFTFTNPTTSATAISNTTTNSFTLSNPTTTAFTFPSSTATSVSTTATGFLFSNSTTTTWPTPFVFSNLTTTNASFPNAVSTFSFPKLTSKYATPSTSGSSRSVPWIRVPSTETQLKQPELNFKDFQKKDTPVNASTQTEEGLRVSKLLRGLKEMLLSSKHSDFILNVKGKEFRVHKIILEAHSPVFAAMMEHDTKEKATGIADIDDCEPLTITNFLNFLYTGGVENLNSDNVIDLYEVADKYQVTELSDLCIEYMINNITIDNFCDILTLSLRHHIRNLTEVATQFFLRNSKEIAVTVQWSAFLTQNPVVGNELFLKALNLENK